MANNQFETMKRNMVKRLFNTKVLNRKDLSIDEMCKVAKTPRPTMYRWLNKFGFSATSDGFVNNKADEEVADAIWSTLTIEKFSKLYMWASEKRFYRIKDTGPKRAYHLTEKGRINRKVNRGRTKEDEQNDQAKNAVLIKNAGIPMVQEAPVIRNLKPLEQTTAIKLHDFVTTDSSTFNQVQNLTDNLLFDTSPVDETVAAMTTLARNDEKFNAIQWAFNERYTRLNQEEKSMLLKELMENQQVDSENADINYLLKAYQQNKDHIDVSKIKGDEKH